MTNEIPTASSLIDDLARRYGEIIGGDTLRLVLGYPTMAALKAAIRRKTLGIPTFLVEGRKGRHALTSEVALWLAKCRANADKPSSQGIPEAFKRKNLT